MARVALTDDTGALYGAPATWLNGITTPITEFARPNPTPLGASIDSVPAGNTWSWVGGTTTNSSLQDSTAAHGPTSIRVNIMDTTTVRVGVSGLTINAAAANLRLWVRAEDISKITALAVFGSSDAGTSGWGNYWKWLVADNTTLTGQTSFIQNTEWVPITLPWAAADVVGAPNKSAVQSLRVDVTGTAGGEIRVGGFDVVQSKATTKGRVTFAFDDGKESVRRLAKPILDKHGFPGSVFLIPGALGTNDYMTEAQVRDLQDLSGWEVASHLGYTEDDQINFPPEDLDGSIARSREWLKSRGYRGAEIGAYPYGYSTRTIVDAARRHTNAAVTASNTMRIKHETLPPSDPMRIRRFPVDAGTTPAQVQAAVDKVAASGEWLVLRFHALGDTSSGITYSTTDFATIVDSIAASNVNVVTVSEALNTSPAPTSSAATVTSGAVNLAPGFASVSPTIVAGRGGYTLPDVASAEGTNELRFLSATLPADTRPGSTVSIEITWASPATGGTGDVFWFGQITDKTNAVHDTDGAKRIVPLPATANTVATLTAPVPGFTAGPGEPVSVRVARNGAHAGDTFTGDVRLLGVRLVYTKA